MSGTGAESDAGRTTDDGIPDPGVAWTPAGSPAPPPPPRNRGLVIAVVALSVLLAVACCGLLGGAFLLRSTETAADRATEAPRSPATGRGPTASAQAVETVEPVQQGPQPSDYPAAQISDLNNVCDGVLYYPQSPRRAGKAPHPVVLLIGDGGPADHRRQDSGYYYDLGLSKRVEQTWASEDPRNVQLVACLDRVSTGTTIRRCKYDDPKPETLTLVKAGYRLRVYEVATGRKLLDKAMGGDDQSCPYVVLVGPDKKIYAEVSDRSLIAALRKLVTA